VSKAAQTQCVIALIVKRVMNWVTGTSAICDSILMFPSPTLALGANGKSNTQAGLVACGNVASDIKTSTIGNIYSSSAYSPLLDISLSNVSPSRSTFGYSHPTPASRPVQIVTPPGLERPTLRLPRRGKILIGGV
jgi:hypothetical protein